jgi:hypothetical protein
MLGKEKEKKKAQNIQHIREAVVMARGGRSLKMVIRLGAGGL